MQIYSWKDARAEREEVRAASSSSSSSFSSDSKGKAREQDDIRQLRRLPRVERGVKEGSGDWQKKVEPGKSSSSGSVRGKGTSKLGLSSTQQSFVAF